MANALVDALVDASLPGRPGCAHLAIVDKLLRMQAVSTGRDATAFAGRHSAAG